jgi:predicted regulator of Ras-like GTPase activity (Roadblock/LC7/MglB family)
MVTLPQLIEEDVTRIDEELRLLLTRTEAATAMIADKGGFLIASHGDGQRYDLTTLAALAAGAFMANETIAGLVNETQFSSVYQQGEQTSLFVQTVDCHCLLVVIFPVQVSIGLVKYFAGPAVAAIARQIQLAHERAPGAGLDLSELNLDNTADFFRRKSV